MIQHHWPVPQTPSRAVVIGGSGFVGQHVTRHLAGLGITTITLSSTEVDLCQPDSVDLLNRTIGPDDVVVVVSAITPDKGRDIRTLMKNLAMGENLCAFFAKSSCAHVVYISSDAVYDDNANPVRESSCCDPSSFHGLMHLARERMLAHTLREKGVPLMVLRPSLLYGPGDTHNGYGPNRYLRSAAAEARISLFGNGEEKRDHVFIGDFSRLLGQCLTHRSAGVLNAATGSSVSFHDVAQEIANAWANEVAVECLPRSNPITHRHFDISATIAAFPTFHYESFETGIRQTIAHMANTPST